MGFEKANMARARKKRGQPPDDSQLGRVFKIVFEDGTAGR